MSGTSIDGVDCVYVKFTENATWSFKIINSKTYKYDDSITEFLIDISKKGIEEIKKIDIEYSKKLAIYISQFIDEFSIKKRASDNEY